MTFKLRKPCLCGCPDGQITTRNGQDVARCQKCDLFQYNAPKLETGRAQRSLATRPGITPSQRARIFAVHDNACIVCGRRPPDVELVLAHIISREIADRYGMLDALIDSEFNLAPMCPEDNSGDAFLSEPSVRLMYRVLLIKATPR